MKNYFRQPPAISSTALLVAVAVFLTAFYNVAFFANVLDVYPLTIGNLSFLLSVAWLCTGFTLLLLSLVCFRWTMKAVVITIFLLSACTGYFMDSYNTIIDESMIRQVVHTDLSKVMDLLSMKLVLYVTLLGIVPSILVYKANIVFQPAFKQVISRLKLFAVTAASMVTLIVIFGDHYNSFILEHKQLRYYANPGAYINATGRMVGHLFSSSGHAQHTAGLDAATPTTDTHREIIVMAGPEAARADRFSLDGYTSQSNPLLKNENAESFTNYWKCGTSTAVSVPCMFTAAGGSSEFEHSTARSTENLLGILSRAGVNVLWLDNKPDSKGVAERPSYESYKAPGANQSAVRRGMPG
jgi:lipid A ethanolaminephosphotransferase